MGVFLCFHGVISPVIANDGDLSKNRGFSDDCFSTVDGRFSQGTLAAMVIEQIEKVKQQYTDKYVQVDGNRAELARFKDLVGQVKTVNMSGRALVEFMDYHLNIGWFDIDLDYLKVVDKPAPKPKEAKKPAAKKSVPKKAAAKPQAASGEKKLSPLEMARQGDSGGAKKKPAAKKSTADVLAALRGGGKPAAKPAAAKVEKPAAAKPAAAKEGPTKVDRSKMSVAEMIAAARGGAKPAKSEPEAEPEAKVETTPTSEPETASPTAEAASPSVAGPVDKSGMSVEEMVAYCREKDA
ncbi:MAG: hypothetical protein GXP24_10160 [Planctomycetes bacterium]|nr:hypothetical protein [Planctomycetota bacterium]